MFASSNFPWSKLICHLSKKDYHTLRLVCKSSRNHLDDVLRTKMDLKNFITRSEDPRYLLRTLYVPEKFRCPLRPEQTPVMVRPPYPQPSTWTISVMTMLSYLSTPLDLRSVFYCVDVVDFKDPTGEQVNDLISAKEEVGCAEAVDKKVVVSRRCIERECACLMAFFPGILDIHYRSFCRGDPEFAEVKANKRARPALRTFENQCTMRICMSRTADGQQQKNGQQWNIVNLKMFSNGKIQMTGCKSVEQARGAVQFLLRKLMEKAPAMRARRDCMTQLRCFGIGEHPSAQAIQQQIRESRLHSRGGGLGPAADAPCFILQQSEAVQLKILLCVENESLFACRRTCRRFRELVESEHFWKRKCEIDLRCTLEHKQHPALATSVWYMATKFNGRFHRMERVRNAEHYSHPRLLYIHAHGLRRHKPFIVAEEYEKLFIAEERIAMINSDFQTNFEINLPVLFKLLLQTNRDSYTNGSRGRIVSCAYSPDDYAALNIKYESPILAEPTCEAIDDKGSSRPSIRSGASSSSTPSGTKTIISFFVFRTGSVIINTAQSIEQEIDAYNFINALFKELYVHIWHTNQSQGKSKTKKG
jgi:hypothetical protein